MASPPSPAPPFTLLLTGLSSTGKTTLSRLLSHAFPGMLLIHQDDFYYTDSQIPIDPTSKLQDWDCVQAFDFHKMAEAVHWVKVNGKARDGVRSLTAESAVGKEKEIDMVGGEEVVRALSEKVEKRLGGKKRTLLVVEGILMLQQGSEVEREADLKMFLRAPRERAKQRREEREGYVTIEGRTRMSILVGRIINECD
jgi:nicotinamide/nicotinate riboside kinase